MTNLLPCPFCGGEAATYRGVDEDQERCGFVCCKRCTASTYGYTLHWHDPSSDMDKSIAEAITAWNTRAKPTSETS